MIKVIRKNGKYLRDRVCPECGKKHFHGENMCVTCRNTQQKKRKSKLPAVECPKMKIRNMRVAKEAARIAFEVRVLQKAGLNYRNATIEQINNAGIVL
jgi:hypothetical protein